GFDFSAEHLSESLYLGHDKIPTLGYPARNCLRESVMLCSSIEKIVETIILETQCSLFCYRSIEGLSISVSDDSEFYILSFVLFYFFDKLIKKTRVFSIDSCDFIILQKSRFFGIGILDHLSYFHRHSRCYQVGVFILIAGQNLCETRIDL